MLRASLMTILFFTLVSGVVRAELGFPSKAFGVSYETTIPDAVLEKTPEWKEESENPPVSARKALTLAEKKMKQMVKVPDDWTGNLDVMALNRKGLRWFWRAQFVWFPKSGGFSGVPPHLDVIVLMD